MNCNSITGNIFLGNIGTPVNYEYLIKNNIKYIINASNQKYKQFDNMYYLNVPIDDTPEKDISQYFTQTNKFIDLATLTRRNVLVHCHMGISRSTSIVLAYLIHTGIPLKNALDFVRLKRKIINPNPGFFKQLQKYEMTHHDKSTPSIEIWDYLHISPEEYKKISNYYD
ncbi:MAG: tyrosine phosphatase [Faunusvirus sp.]|jgi:protein-tyrosine phosphatase|uniref:Tyrosine phosphatase n=1 Tax=Faunusvirus sp. TaxID=2487766 RepID=A0A3G4ZXR6_9VIRU|nr:MAG: tyrosine phosphatase [Faunusvirus sp.]